MSGKYFKNVLLAAIALAGILATAAPSQAQIFSTCDRYGSWSQGAWTIYNDVWGNRKPGTQCLYVNSINSWYVNSKQSQGGVKSYPNTGVSPQTDLSLMRSATATFDTTSPDINNPGYSFDWTFDLWTANGADEIMILENLTGSGGGWGTQIASNVTVGGQTFSSVWQAAPGWNVIQFIPATKLKSGTVDCLAVMNWCKTRGILTNTIFDKMQFGVEITSTNNTWQIFSLNNYHASWSNTSGGGSSI